MIKNLDLYSPDFIINCHSISCSGEIYSLMRKNNIKRAYTYAMVWFPKPLYIDFLKVGMSAPKLGEKREYQVGERIVRQLSWVPGWDEPAPFSDNGSAFWHSIKYKLIEDQKIIPDSFNKNNLSVAVWDISKRIHFNNILSSDEEYDLCVWSEGELAAQYKKKNHGKLPLLNITDPSKSKIYKGHYVPKDTFNNLFEFS